MPRFLTRIACPLGILLCAGIDIGIAAESPDPPPRYEVELIVFRHIDQSRSTPETPAARSIFRSSPLELTLAEPVEQTPQMSAAPAGPGDIASAANERRPPISFQILELQPSYPDFVPLRGETRTLNNVYNRLQRIDAYEPIAHIGWVQPARNTDNAAPYRLEPSTVGDVGLAGTVTLYKSRFLHLELDLVLEGERHPVETRFFLGNNDDEQPDVHKLTESRRVRGTVAHYFDNPRFGVIARVEAVQDAETRRKETG